MPQCKGKGSSPQLSDSDEPDGELQQPSGKNYSQSSISFQSQQEQKRPITLKEANHHKEESSIERLHKSYQQSSFAISPKVKKGLNDKEQLSRRRHSEYDLFSSKRYPGGRQQRLDTSVFKTLGDKTSKSEDFEFLLSLYDKMIYVNNSTISIHYFGNLN